MKQPLPKLDDTTVRQLLAHYYWEVATPEWESKWSDDTESMTLLNDLCSVPKISPSGPQEDSNPLAIYWKLFLYSHLTEFEQETLEFFHDDRDEPTHLLVDDRL